MWLSFSYVLKHCLVDHLPCSPERLQKGYTLKLANKLGEPMAPPTKCSYCSYTWWSKHILKRIVWNSQIHCRLRVRITDSVKPLLLYFVWNKGMKFPEWTTFLAQKIVNHRHLPVRFGNWMDKFSKTVKINLRGVFYPKWTCLF